MNKDIHYQYWLLMIPYYAEKWGNGVDYDELMKEYKLKQNIDE